MRRVPASIFRLALATAAAERPQIAESCTAPADLPHRARYYLAADGRSGFGIDDGELIGLFSAAAGRGRQLVNAAVDLGARRLDCFDGYLPELYAWHGFVETRRESNWSPGGPDVVYMSYSGSVRENR